MITSVLLLTSCGGEVTNTPSTESVSTAKSALYVQSLFSDPQAPKSSSALGVFTTYLLETESASRAEGSQAGVESLRDIEGTSPEEDYEEKSYEILRSLGTVIQTDLIEVLNRSTDRTAALNTYLESLIAVDQHGSDQLTKLQSDMETIDDERKTVRKERSAAKREVKNLLKNSDYEAASQQQKKLADIELNLAKIEAERDRIKELKKQYEDFLEISGDRIAAIENNREILISGLRVVNLPGIKDLKLIEKK